MSGTEYIYGVHAALEVLRAKRRAVHRAWVAEGDTGAGLRGVRRALENQEVKVRTVPRGYLKQLCDNSEHQGVVVEAAAYPYERIETLAAMNRLVVLDNVEDPHNVGAVLRSALFFGWRGVLLSLRGVPGVYPSVVKASAGAVEHLLVVRDRSANRCLAWLRAHDYRVAALDSAGTISPDELAAAAPKRLALVVGGEHRGVGQYIRMHADAIVGIAGQGPIDSLNASVAAGIVLSRLAESLQEEA